MLLEYLERNIFSGDLFIINPVYKIIFTSLNEKDSIFILIPLYMILSF